MRARDLFAELMQGVENMADQRDGTITLCNTSIEDIPDSDVETQEIAGTEVEHDT